jgi:hypothetical protein
MDDFVPATGRVLRYWRGALSALCRERLYDYLGVQPVAVESETEASQQSEWVCSEVWQATEPGHESTVVLDRSHPSVAGLQIPTLRKRVHSKGSSLTRPFQRRPGMILGHTFESTRSRRARARPGASIVSMF